MSARDRDYYQRNKEMVKEKNRAYYYADLEKTRAQRAKHRALHRLEANERERLRAIAIRLEMIAAYGVACSCCGESEPLFLELDHVDGRGKQHREAIGRGSKTTYTWLKRNGWPREGYDLLCSNCHQGRHRNGGICPHKGKADAFLVLNGEGDIRR